MRKKNLGRRDDDKTRNERYRRRGNLKEKMEMKTRKPVRKNMGRRMNMMTKS